jgi:hypothetical protein
VSLRQWRLRLIYLLLAPLALARRCRHRRSGWIIADRDR